MSKNLYLIVRILGNDLDGLHGDNQTFSNLKFTLKNENKFEKTDKLFVLNRIVNLDKKNKIIKLLKKYNMKFLDIPFDINEFNKLPLIIPSFSEYKNLNRINKVKTLEKYNLYLVNNNACRNYCIEYGKTNGYQWTFVLDSNNYFTQKAFDDIVNNININDEYLIIPQKRLKDHNYCNDLLLRDDCENKIDNLPIQEPQIAFKNSSKIVFNENIPYGLAPKAELLTALGVKGVWNNWLYFYGLDIKPRKFTNNNYKILSKIVRLNPYSNNNDIKNNWELRWIGIYLLVQEILNKNFK